MITPHSNSAVETLGLKRPPVARKNNQADTSKDRPIEAEIYLYNTKLDGSCHALNWDLHVTLSKRRTAGGCGLGSRRLDAAEPDEEEKDGASELETCSLEVIGITGEPLLTWSLVPCRSITSRAETHDKS